MNEEKSRCWSCARLTFAYDINVIHCRCKTSTKYICVECCCRLPDDEYCKYIVNPCCSKTLITKSAHKK